MASIAEQFVEYLEDHAVGTTGESLFIGEIPDGEAVEDQAVVVNIIGGPRDKFVNFRHATGSIVIRSATYEAGTALYETISALVHKNPLCITELIVGGNVIKDMYVLDEPSYAAKDDNQRYIFEFQITIDYVGN